MLHDCINKGATTTELFLVRAGRCAEAVAQERDRFNQAVLPVYTTLVDARTAALADVLDDRSYKGVIMALGIGINLTDHSSIADSSHLRYRSVVVVVDGSTDGRDVAYRLISFLERYMRVIITSKRLFTVDVGRNERHGDFAAAALAPDRRQLVKFQEERILVALEEHPDSIETALLKVRFVNPEV